MGFSDRPGWPAVLEVERLATSMQSTDAGHDDECFYGYFSTI